MCNAAGYCIKHGSFPEICPHGADFSGVKQSLRSDGFILNTASQRADTYSHDVGCICIACVEW
jgi:hypothetical protein